MYLSLVNRCSTYVFLGYAHKMYFLGRLSLFMLILAPMTRILGESDVCDVQIKSEDKFLDEDGDKMYIAKDNDKNDIHEILETTNVSLANSTIPSTTKVNCLTDKTYGPVELVNATRLRELLILESGPSNRTRNDKNGKQQPGTCVLVLFYARWCVFSSQAAPHFNALPRSFPHIKSVAIDAIKYQSFNAQYGIVGVPTLMLVHNRKPVAKFNITVYTLDTFAGFILHFTTLRPSGPVFVTSADFSGPVPSTPSNETDYCLVLSWVYIAACALYFISKSRWWRQFIELVQNTWRESNAQHEHVD